MEQWRADLYRDVLYHHGKRGMKWGIRRYQNEDGSLTPLGRKHYGVGKERAKSFDKLNSNKSKARELKDQVGKSKAASDAETDRKNREKADELIRQYNIAGSNPVGDSLRAEKADELIKRYNKAKESGDKDAIESAERDIKSWNEHMRSVYADEQAKADDRKKKAQDDIDAWNESRRKETRDKAEKELADLEAEQAKLTAAQKAANTEDFANKKVLSTNLRTASNSLGTIGSFYSRIKGNRRASRIDFSKLSDDDLRREINRMQLEQNYAKLVSTNTEKGEYRVQSLLNLGAAGLEIGSSAVGLASSLQKLRQDRLLRRYGF